MIKDFLPQILMVIFAGLILFFVGRKVPSSLKGLGEEEIKNGNGSPDEIKGKELKEKILRNLEKFLRKVKAVFLKGDTKIMEAIKKLQKKRAGETGFEAKDSYGGEDENRPRFSLKRLRKRGVSGGRRFKSPLGNQRLRGAAGTRVFPKKDINIADAKKAMFEQRERVLIKKISLNPKNDEAYLELGKLYRESNNIKDAKASFKQAIKLNKGNVLAKKILKEMEDNPPI